VQPSPPRRVRLTGDARLSHGGPAVPGVRDGVERRAPDSGPPDRDHRRLPGPASVRHWWPCLGQGPRWRRTASSRCISSPGWSLPRRRRSSDSSLACGSVALM